MADALRLGDDAPDEVALPALRDDLGLFQGPRNSRGEPTWTLHDPVRNRYFSLGEREFEMLSRWHEAGTVSALVDAAAADGVAFSGDDVLQFAAFLRHTELTQGDAGIVKRLLAAHQARQHSFWREALSNYLFIRIPLVRPDPILDWLYPLLRPLLSRRFAQVTALVGILALVLVARQWDLFVTTFLGFWNWEGAAAFGMALILVKVLHETGHALACRHFGLRVPTIGVAIIVLWPVMFTDATEAWRLTSRRARVMIAAAGMLTEVSIACYATLFWVVLPDGLLRSVAFTLATTTWVMSLLVNLNPFMRFDGYYLFADLFNIPNLQERGYALARNRLRHVLFGVPLVADPSLRPRDQRIAMVWAFATWIYRFFLFLGIALLVYRFFFKALGILLFAVEIWWFILLPIWREVSAWREHLAEIDPRRKRIALFGGGGLLLLLLVPWESDFTAPAVMRAGEYQKLFPVEPSQVKGAYVRNGETVRKGQLLYELQAPDLEAEIATMRAEVSSAEFDLGRVMASQETAQDRLVMEGALAKSRAGLAGLEARLAQQRMTAPFDGIVSDVPPAIRAGVWVGEKQSLGLVVGTQGGVAVDAYVTEEHLRFIKVGDAARFMPDDVLLGTFRGRVERVDQVDTRVLGEPYLAGPYGGGIPVRSGENGVAVPEQAVYFVRVRLEAAPGDVPMRVVRGHLLLGGDSRSLLGRMGTWIGGVLLRESGF